MWIQKNPHNLINLLFLIHPKMNGQQAPETYNTLRYTQEGSVSRDIIENELKGDISNFTNEEINAAIASYNTKNQG